MRSTFIILLLVILGACSRTQPIYSVEDAVVVTGSGETPSREKVRGAIVEAAVSKTWQVTDSDEDSISATLTNTRWRADIVINYDPEHYSIFYGDSTRLMYDGTMIHRNYNKWIKGLQQRINEYLLQL